MVVGFLNKSRLPCSVSYTHLVQRRVQKYKGIAFPGGHLEEGESIYAVSYTHLYNVNVIGAVRLVESFLPLMQTGMKRFAFVSSESGSISVSHRDGGYPYPSSKTALNMTVRRMYRTLQPQGYTFRLYHPGWVRSYMGGQKSTNGNFEPEETAACLLYTSIRFLWCYTGF